MYRLCDGDDDDAYNHDSKLRYIVCMCTFVGVYTHCMCVCVRVCVCVCMCVMTIVLYMIPVRLYTAARRVQRPTDFVIIDYIVLYYTIWSRYDGVHITLLCYVKKSKLKKKILITDLGSK